MRRSKRAWRIAMGKRAAEIARSLGLKRRNAPKPIRESYWELDRKSRIQGALSRIKIACIKDALDQVRAAQPHVNWWNR